MKYQNQNNGGTMIFYKPIYDLPELKHLFPDKQFNSDCIYGGYVTEEEDNKILIEIKGFSSRIIEISSVGDSLTVEGLIRAALNFAGNRNAYTVNCKSTEYDSVLRMLGFSEENGEFTGEIPELLKGSCCKGK